MLPWNSVLNKPSLPILKRLTIFSTLFSEYLSQTLNWHFHWLCLFLEWNLLMECTNLWLSIKLEDFSSINFSKNGFSSLSYLFQFMELCHTLINHFQNIGILVLLKTVQNTFGKNGFYSETSNLMGKFVFHGFGSLKQTYSWLFSQLHSL